jgi:hypothetical protein
MQGDMLNEALRRCEFDWGRIQESVETDLGEARTACIDLEAGLKRLRREIEVGAAGHENS